MTEQTPDDLRFRKAEADDRDVCVLSGGPRHRWVYFADELVRNGQPTSLARGYRPTQRRILLSKVWPFDTSSRAGYQCWVWEAAPRGES
jgi:hypothetical protein